MNTVEFVDGSAPGISAALLNEPFQIKGASNSEGNIVLTIGTGRANFGSLPLVEKLTDSQYIIPSTEFAANMTYYIFLKKDGSFIHFASNGETNVFTNSGQVLLGAVHVDENLNMSRIDLRGMLPGCYETVPSLMIRNRVENTPFLEFYSSGNGGYDARISCTNGNATPGNGDIICNANYLQVDDEVLNKWAILGNTDLYAENPEHGVSYQNGGYSKKFRVRYTGNYRVYAEIRTSDGSYPAHCSASNGSGVARSVTSPYSSYYGYTMDLIGIQANDVITVYCGVGGDQYHTYTTGGIRNIRVRCDFSNKSPFTYGPLD